MDSIDIENGIELGKKIIKERNGKILKKNLYICKWCETNF